MRKSHKPSAKALEEQREALRNQQRAIKQKQEELKRALAELPRKKEEEQRRRREAIRSSLPQPARGSRLTNPADLLERRTHVHRVNTGPALARERRSQRLQFAALVVILAAVVWFILRSL